LFFEIIRLLKGKSSQDKPKWLLFENVRNLVSIRCGGDFTTILREISDVGYDCEWQIINSRMFVPQNRERIFIVGHLRGGSTRKVFPISGANHETADGELIEVISGMQGKRVYCSQGLSICLTAQAGGFAGKTGAYCVGSNPCFVDLCAGNPRTTDIARCLKARYNSGISNRTGELSGVLTNGRIRRLTPRECFRLQGFSDEMFNRAAAVNSDNQLYRQAGNSVTVPVIRAIGEGLVRAYES
jgi:DNA (cytosine-5)-methyltransferase 1